MISHQQIGERLENATLFNRFVLFHMLSASRDACAQSHQAFVKNGFKLIARDGIEHPHHTLSKLALITEVFPISAILSFPKR
jgi:hypothetical protein